MAWLVVGALFLTLSALGMSPSANVQQPRPTLTPTPEMVPSPTAMPPGEPPPAPQPPETVPSPQTLPSTGPSLLPVTGYGLTAVGIGFGMAAAALAARWARRRNRPEDSDYPQEP